MPQPFERLGKVLAVLRTHRGWTKRELARRAGVGEAVLSRYETGERQPRMTTLAAILEALGAVPYFELEGMMYNLSSEADRRLEKDVVEGVDLERVLREIEDLGRRLEGVESAERRKR